MKTSKPIQNAPGDWESVAVSRGGRQVLTGSWDGTAKLWDAETGQLVMTLTGHYFRVSAVGFLGDGQRLWTAERFGGRVWDKASGQLLRIIDGYGPPLDTAFLHPDRRHLLASGWYGPSALWDSRSGRLVRTLEGRANALSPDGQQVLTGSSVLRAEYTAKLWDTFTGQLLRTFGGHTGEVTSVTFSPDGQQVLTGSADGTAKLWTTGTGQLRYTFEHTAGDQATTPAPAFSRDGRRVFTGGSWDGQAWEPLKAWDTATGELLRTCPNGSALFSRDMQHVLLCADDMQTLTVFDTSTGQPAATGHDEPGWRFVLSCYPCRLWDLAQFSDGDIETNRRVWENGLEGIGDLSHNGRWALSRDGRTLLDAQWGQLLRTFTV